MDLEKNQKLLESLKVTGDGQDETMKQLWRKHPPHGVFLWALLIDLTAISP